MSSTTVAQHTTQPLNFGPEWLRALSTPDASTPIPSSSGSGSGNIFKFSATKYRYSKDEILALRAKVTERLAEEIRNEIMENLKDVESVYRPNIIEPLTLTAPTAEESAKMSSLSSYISGRTPGGGGRGGHGSQQSQQHTSQDSRGRGGGSMSNGRGGGGSRGRGGRENAFGPNRGNNNPDDNAENAGGGEDQSSSSWSRGGGFHSRSNNNAANAGGGSFKNRVRSYDDREQSQPFRRGPGGTTQTSEGWRRSKGDDDENNEQNEDSPSAHGSTSWTSRTGPTRRGGGGASLEHRTKSNDKWSHSDDRPGQSNSNEPHQTRSNSGWRANYSMSDRDLNSRRPPLKRERTPEWMDDNNEGDVQLSGATFEQGGTFVESSSSTSTRVDHDNNNEQKKLQTQTSSEEIPAQTTSTAPTKTQEENKVGKVTPPRTDTALVNAPPAVETTVAKPTPPVVQHPTSAWDDDFEPSDVATLVVESTLADDHDYSPPISAHPSSHLQSNEPIPSAMSIIPQPQRVQPPAPAPMIDDKQWFYRDPQNIVQGPFSSADMERWYTAGYFTTLLPVKRLGETQFSTIQQLMKELGGRLPFRSDASTPVQSQQTIVSESQKFNLIGFNPSASTNNTAYLEDYLLQQQQQSQSRPNLQHAMLFNRQTSMPASTAEPKVTSSSSMVSSPMRGFFGSQQQLTSSVFPNNLVTDPNSVYQQQASQLQRSISATNQQGPSTTPLDGIQRSFRQLPSTSSSSPFFNSNISVPQFQQQQQNDIMTRLAQAMQSHEQQQEKAEEQRRIKQQQQRELEIERLKFAQQHAEQFRLQQEEERRRAEQIQQQNKLDEEMRKKKEAVLRNQILLEQMKEMTKNAEQRKISQVPATPTAKVEIDPAIAFQQSLQFQKAQQAKIEADKAENIQRYQQQLREQSRPSPSVQAQAAFKLPESANWARHSLQSNDQNSQPLNFAEIQKQEQEQERRAREAMIAAQQQAKTETTSTSQSSSSGNKSNSWARTLFAGTNSSTNNSLPSTSSHVSSNEHESNETTLPESPMTSYNQQATNAVLSLLNIHPKSRSAATSSHSQSAPWSTTNTTQNTSLQDIQRQQQQSSQIEVKQHQTQSSTSSHGSTSTPAWGGIFSQSTSSPSSSMMWGENPNSPLTSNKSSTVSGNKSTTSRTETKSVSASSSSEKKSNPTNAEMKKSEREAQFLFNPTRTQDALSKWTQTQFKDNLQSIDVPTLVQLLKDIDSAEEIFEYVQPYIGSVSKAKEFSQDFIAKRNQLLNAEPDLDNERLNALAMAPTSTNRNSSNTGDEGFQVASSNGQKKKAKKMKGQKLDVKQLGFMVNNRPEQRDGIERVNM